MTQKPVHPIPEVSIVVPVYNSQTTVEGLAERVFATLEGIGRTGEIVFVDDGSADGSWAILEKLSERYPGRITAVQLMRNFGQHNALMCGFHHVRGGVVVTMDDDLQNPPEEIPKLLTALDESGNDLVYGRYWKKQHVGWRNLGSRTILAFYRFVFQTKIGPTSFRAFRAHLLPSLLNYHLNYTYIDGLINWSTRRIGQVDVEHAAREHGRSGYRISTLLLLASNLFTNFSILPLQLVSLVGLTTATLGIFGALFYLVQYSLNQIAVPGFATIIIALLVIGGLQMLALGVIGEYLGRMHLNVNRKPQFVVRQFSCATAELPVPLSETGQSAKLAASKQFQNNPGGGMKIESDRRN